MAPLLPLDALPDLIANEPLIPLSVESADRRLNEPLLVAVPWPDTIEIDPPVRTVLSPALSTIRPPAPEFPLPTLTLILPLAPVVAEPDLRTIDPLLPLEVEPVLNDRDPLLPLAPASALRIVNAPLLDVEP
jgi:hypothetical protein